MHRTALQAAATLGAVVGLYVSPWLLGLITQDRPAFQVVQLPTFEREAVLWSPMERPAEDTAEEVLAAPIDAAEPVEEQGVAEAQPVDVPAPELVAPPSPTARVKAHAKPSKKPQMTKRPARKRAASKVARRPVPKRVPKVLTKKQQRRKDKWKKLQGRLAEQEQCSDHIEQMLKIEETEKSDEWLVGQDLVRCYRAHPQQFMNMGGMGWAEEDGKKLGLKIYVSSKDRGLVARTIGFERGDILRSFNGFSLRNMATLSLAITQLTSNKAKIKYLRDGQSRIFKVKVVSAEELEQARSEQIALAEAQEHEERPRKKRRGKMRR